MKIVACWMLFAMAAVWLVANSGLRAISFPLLFPSGRGISTAMRDPSLGVWVCNISLLSGIFFAGHLLISWLKPHEAKVHNLLEYFIKLVPLTLIIVGILVLMLAADLQPGTGTGRGSDLFRLLSASTFGIGVLASIFTLCFGVLIWMPLQTMRVGYHLLRSAT